MQGLLNKAGLGFVSTMGLPTYEALTLEFLSSYFYITPTDADANLFGAATFRMFNQEYTVNQDALSDMFRFPRGDNVQYRIPPELDWNRTSYELWERISGEHNVAPEARYSSHIHNPNIRYLHRTLASTIFGRTNNNKVNTKELYALHCAFALNLRLNPSTFLMAHIQNLVTRDGTVPFCIGGIVTVIAVHLNLGGRILNLPSLPAVFLDINNYRDGLLIKVR